jgi:ATP-dependent Lon protease
MTKTKDAAIPVVPLRDMAPQPGTTLPMFVGREKSKNAVRAAAAGKTPIILVSQKSIAVENPNPSDLYGVGIIGELNQVFEHPDGTIRIVVTSKARGLLRNVQNSPLIPGEGSGVRSDHLVAEFDQIRPEPASADVAKAAKSAVKSFGTYCKVREDDLLAESRQLLGRLNEVQTQVQALRAANESVGKLTDPAALADLIPGCIHTRVQPEKLGDPEVVKTLDTRIRAKQAILSEPDPAKRLQLLRKFVEDEAKG